MHLLQRCCPALPCCNPPTDWRCEVVRLAGHTPKGAGLAPLPDPNTTPQTASTIMRRAVLRGGYIPAGEPKLCRPTQRPRKRGKPSFAEGTYLQASPRRCNERRPVASSSRAGVRVLTDRPLAGKTRRKRARGTPIQPSSKAAGAAKVPWRPLLAAARA